MKGVPNNQMPMPEGIVTVRIDRKNGCPARAGQADTIFEVFRDGHVPECQTELDTPRIFNDTMGVDDLLIEDEVIDEETEDETLF